MFSQTTIIGRLGQSPRMTTSRTGKSVCSFSVAVDTGYGEQKRTDWFNVATFGKTAENANAYLTKGSLVCVVGAVHLNTYQGKDGTTKASLELVGNDVRFLTPKSERPEQQPQQQTSPSPGPSPSQDAAYFGETDYSDFDVF